MAALARWPKAKRGFWHWEMLGVLAGFTAA